MRQDWIESKTDELLAIARASKFKRDILSDASGFESQGFVPDVALAMSIRYWEGCPITGKLPMVKKRR
jgi:hypothetical protein